MSKSETARRRKKKARRRYWWLILLVSALAAVCVLITLSDQMTHPLLPSWAELFEKAGLTKPGPLDSELQVRVIDVGNADAILVRNKSASLLIDAGEKGDGETVVNALRQQGVQRLDYLIATHPDADHIGGMAEVIAAFEVDKFLMAPMPEGSTPTTKVYANMLEALLAKGLKITEAKPGARYELGDARLDILGPTADYEETNNQSVVCKVTFGGSRLLFMGDAEREAENALLAAGTDLSADVIKLGHHGSASSSQRQFLEAVGAKTALITCGAGNAYGHPDKETLQTLKALGITGYRSDLCGDIVLTTDGETITVETQKGAKK